MKQWTLLKLQDVLKTNPFIVQSLELMDNVKQAPLSHPFYRLKSPDWVNILPVTRDGKAVLVRQQRAGIMEDTVEIPGGVMDKGEDPSEAALRELEEETGYSSSQLISIGKINPNPAIMTNMLHMFIALDCRLKDQREHFPDENESIQIITRELSELENMIANNELNSALAALTVLASKKHWPEM